MRRQVKQYIKKSLCGILSAAMILTSLSIPELTAYAAGAGDEAQIFEEESGSAADEAQNGAEIEKAAPEGADSANEDAKEAEDNNEEIKEAEAAEDKAEEAETNEDEERIVRESDNREGTNLIVNGDFTNGTTSWEVDNIGSTSDTNEKMSSYGTYLYKWGDNTYTITVSQQIQNVAAGKYIASIEAGGEYDANVFSLQVLDNNSSSLATKNFTAGRGWGAWDTFKTDTFEIAQADSSITVKISGVLPKDKQIHLDNVKLEAAPSHTLSDLTTLYESVKNYKEEDYKAEGWGAFQTALNTASGLITQQSSNGAEIDSAYTALENAKNALKIADINATFYYYAQPNKTFGAVTWDKKGITLVGSADDWSKDVWKLTDSYNAKVCLLKESAEYPGWYSLNIKFDPSVTDDGFDIYTTENVETMASKEFACDKQWNNKEIYEKLTSKNADKYAVRKYGNTPVLHEGGDATAAMRNVTLNVYSADGTPAIGTSSELAAFNEATGAKSTLTASSTADGKNYYDMTPSGSSDGWYSLTFSAPAAAEADAKIFGVYTKKESAYTLVKEFTNTEFADAFTGKLYYKGGFFDTKAAALAGGTTLGMIKELYASEAFKAIMANGADYYTADSWNKFNTAKTAAEALTNNTTDADNSSVTPAIEAAYKALDEAIKGMAAKPAVTVFYYYNDSIADSEELGATFWAGDNASVDENIKASWSAWDGAATYKFTPVEGHKGWYSIPIAFGSSKKGFDIHKKGDSATKVTGVDQAQYPAADNKAFALKDGKYYKGKELAEALVRKVTLYVYDAAGTPAIRSTERLVSADETSQTLTSLTPSENTGSLYNYDMGEVNGKENWYMMTFSAPNADAEGKICELYTHSDSYTLVTKFLNKAAAGGKEFNFSPIFGAEYKGTAYYKEGKFYKSINDADGVTFEQLTKLIAKAEEKAESQYTAASWTEFAAKLAATKALTVQSSADEIKAAYEALDAAMKGLKEKGNELTFRYYAGDVGSDEVAIFTWSDKNNITFNADEASWKGWGTNTVYKMTPSAKYKGWYSILVTFAGAVSDSANFQIFKQSETGTPIFKCGSTGNKDNGGNDAIYNKLFNGTTGGSYAVKTFGSTSVLYEGEADSTAAMRSITLYAYSADAVPAIGSASELKAVNASTGAIEAAAGKNTADGINYYDMTADADKPGWYSLSFCAPEAAADTKEIARLYTKSGGNYTLVKKFAESAAAADFVDFNQVFEGKIYYKDGILYNDIQLAEGITLKMLRELIASENVKAVSDNGESKYTGETWSLFAAALAAAQKAVSDCGGGAEDTLKNDSITQAYGNLNDAVKGMKLKPAEPTAVTFYYYNDKIDEDEELGITFGDKDKSYSTAEMCDWYVWSEGDARKMTAVDGYPGWYKIPVVFVSEGTTYKWFRISSHEKGDEKNKTEEVQLGDNYPSPQNGETAYAYKGNYYLGEETVKLLMRNVTLYAYSENGTPAIEYSGTLKRMDENTGKSIDLEASGKNGNNNCYDMTEDDMSNWYSLELSIPAASESGKVLSLVTKGADGKYTLVKDLSEADITPVFGGAVYYKDGQFSKTRDIALADLKNLIKKAEKLRDDDIAAEKTEPKTNKYHHDKKIDGGKWDDFVEEIKDADETANKTSPTNEEIKEAYESLIEAMEELIPSSSEVSTIKVAPVAVAENFIMGADLSSYVSLKQSGTVFKDEEGDALSDKEFFELIKDGGTNWVRIRVWNDPYNGDGKGYGGGNSDLAKAKTIGKLATDAGMRVLIDFHYSDFWADPGKQETPKAWKNYTLEQKEKVVYDYTLESLKALKAAGVDVGMVQVGNETNNAVCGEKNWNGMSKIFSAGSRAVKEFDKDCLVALHFADPSSNKFSTYAAKLKDNNVEYDVFAASYYPFWHGTTGQLTGALEGIARDYGKKVMVAETSWVTTWNDGDGHENTSPKTTQTLNYPVSVQGQADEMRDVVQAVQAVNNDLNSSLAIGVFYWEPAWISPNYAYSGKALDKGVLSKNQELWEKYGSGWASSYATEYDPVDAGQWYGGSAVDNQAWFDFNGQALPTVNTYKYIRKGSVAASGTNAIDDVEDEIEAYFNVGDTINWQEFANQVGVTFSDGSRTYVEDAQKKKILNPHFAAPITIKWDEKQQAAVHTDKTGEYEVEGIATIKYYENEADKDSPIKTEKYEITLDIKVLSNGNILKNGGFEDSSKEPWKEKLLGIIDADGNPIADVTDENYIKDASNAHVEVKTDDPHSGNQGWHFWSSRPVHFTIEQTVEDLEKGVYTAGGFLQGSGAAPKDLQTLYVKVYDEDAKTTDEPKIKYTKTCSLNGWKNWVNPEISNIRVDDDDTVVVGMEILSTVELAWGTIDDMYLYGKYGIGVKTDAQTHGAVNVSSMEADSKEVVRIAAMPENGYYLSALKLTGDAVKMPDDVLKDSLTGSVSKPVLQRAADSGTAKPKKTVELVCGADREDAAMQAYFIMPDCSVDLEAVFEPIAELQPGADKVDITNVTAKGFAKEANGDKYIYNPGTAGYKGEEYTGKAIMLNLELSYKGYKLTSADYAAAYANNVNESKDADMAKITIKAKGSKFKGTRDLYFKIADSGKADISKAKAELKDSIPGKKDTYYYTGEEIEPVIDKLVDSSGNALALNGAELVLAEDDYTVYYEKNINVGKATMYVFAREDSTKIKGTFKQTFTIEKCPIADEHGALINDITVDPDPVAGGTYTGSKITPNVTVRYKNKVLQKGKDYTVTYKNNVNANVSKNAQGEKVYIEGSKQPLLKITGKGSYKGAAEEYQFNIETKDVNALSIKAAAEDVPAGKPCKLTVYDGKKKLSLGRQYIIDEIIFKGSGKSVYTADSDAKANAALTDAGTYEITIKGVEKGGYSGIKKNIAFRAVDPKNMIASVKINARSKAYTGQELGLEDADIEVKTKGGKVLGAAEYDISYEDLEGNKTNIKVGAVTVTVTGKGDYAGTKKTSFKIAKIPMTNGGNAGKAASADLTASITWKPKKDTLLEKIKQNGGASELPYTGYAWKPELDISAKIGSNPEKLLVKDVDYTISYKKNLKAKDEAAVIVKGKGNYSGTVTFENVFTVKEFNLSDFVMMAAPAEYTGSALKPKINFVYKATGTQMDVKEGAAYSVKYENNKNVASVNSSEKPAITITQKGKPDKKETLYFTITTGRITAESVKELKVQKYNGKPAEPKLSVTVSGKSLKAGKDYIVTYTGNNRQNDKAYANIIGIGNYSGTVNKEFVIY